METEELKKKFLKRDRIINVVSKNGSFRAVAIKNTTTVQTAQKFHNLDSASAYFLAKTMTAATMISAFLKGEERVIVDITSDGLISEIYAEALQVGECRGFVKLADKDTNSEINNIRDILGKGKLTVSRILYNHLEPIVSVVPLLNGDVSTDIEHYFLQSEQINSAVIIDVEFDDNENIITSGGILVQAMPGALQEEIDTVVSSITEIDKFCEEIEHHDSLEELLKYHLPFEFDVVKTKQVDFFCRCSMESFKSKLLLIGSHEIEDMRKDGHNELVCQYCNKKYYLTDKDFDEILGQLKAKNN